MSPQDVARQILSERRFHRSSLPQPLRKPLHSLGEDLKPIGHWLSHAFHNVASALPGGATVLWILLALLVAAVSVAVARHGVQRTRPADLSSRDGAAGEVAPSRRELERQAEQAERAGRFDAAVRLRFGAGLLALAQRGLIEERPSLRSGEVAATLASDDFDAVASAFDEVVYGGRPAVADDARAAREGWRAVLAQARR